MWLAYLVLFVALCPGTIFTVNLGKNTGKLAIASVHAVIFVIIINLLYVTEGFAAETKEPTPGKVSNTPSKEETALIKARIAHDAALSKDADNILNEQDLEKSIQEAISTSKNDLNALNTLLQSNTFQATSPMSGASISSAYSPDHVTALTSELGTIVKKQTALSNTKTISDLNKKLTSLKTKLATDRATLTKARDVLATANTAAVSKGLVLGASSDVKCAAKSWKRTESVGENGKITFCEPCTTKYIYNMSVSPTPITRANSSSYSSSCK